MKHLLLVSLLTAAAVGTSSAITLSVVRAGAGTGLIAQNTSNVSLAGNFWAAGTFAAGVPVITDGPSLALAVAPTSFLVFASATTPAGTPGVGTAGTLTGSLVGNGTTVGPPPTTAATFNSQPLHFIVGNGTTRATSTEWAIFSVVANPTFPSDVTPGTLITVTLDQQTKITMVSGAGTAIESGAAVSDRIQLASVAVIPEPSTSALFVAFAGSLLLIRRRK